MWKRVFVILLLALMAVSFFVLMRRNIRLRSEIAALKGRAEALKVAAPEVSRAVVDSSARAREEKLELMRLRGEVTQLRQQVREFSAERAGTQRDFALEPVEFAAPIPVEQWVRAGAATPEDAAQSLVNYLFKLNTSTNEMEIKTNHPPSISSYFPGSNSEDFTNTTALMAGLLERVDEIVSFQMGAARPGAGMPGESDPDRMVYKVIPVRINYAGGTSRVQNITFRAGTTVENGQFNPTGSWSPRITFEIVDGRPRARF